MIRRATYQDVEAIFQLDSKVFMDSLSLSVIDNDLKNNPNAYYFVAELAGKIVGYIGAWIYDNTEILNFCVDNDFRNNGLGTKLFNELKLVSVGMMTLEVRETNLGAIRFYERQGFVKALVRKNYYSNGDNAILMVKEWFGCLF